MHYYLRGKVNMVDLRDFNSLDMYSTNKYVLGICYVQYLVPGTIKLQRLIRYALFFQGAYLRVKR